MTTTSAPRPAVGRPSLRARARVTLARPEVRDALSALLLSRIVVAVAAVLGALLISENTKQSPAVREAPGFGSLFDGWPATGVLDALFTPLLRWDALWYLTIARDGYEPLGLPGNTGERPAFFPLYPLLTWLFGGWAGPVAALFAALVVSFVASFGALVLLHRLVSIELGERYARPAVLLLAFFPTAHFLSAPYTESLFLLLTIGCVYAARTGHWAWAGILVALASATRNTGVLLLLPLLLLHLREQGGWRPGRDVLWLALGPLGIIAYSVFLQLELGNALAWSDAQDSFGRAGLALPTTTFRLALVGVRDFVSTPSFTGAANVYDIPFVVLIAVACVGLVRRMRIPIAYAAYAAAAAIPPLCAPFGGEALRSFPRFTLVIFPVVMWLAWVCENRGWTGRVVAGSGALLAVTTALFASWYPFV